MERIGGFFFVAHFPLNICNLEAIHPRKDPNHPGSRRLQQKMWGFPWYSRWKEPPRAVIKIVVCKPTRLKRLVFPVGLPVFFSRLFFFCGNSFAKGLLTIAGVGFLAGGALTIGWPRGVLAGALWWFSRFVVVLFLAIKIKCGGNLKGSLTEEFLVNSAKFCVFS